MWPHGVNGIISPGPEIAASARRPRAILSACRCGFWKHFERSDSTQLTRKSGQFRLLPRGSKLLIAFVFLLVLTEAAFSCFVPLSVRYFIDTVLKTRNGAAIWALLTVKGWFLRNGSKQAIAHFVDFLTTATKICEQVGLNARTSTLPGVIDERRAQDCRHNCYN